MANPALSVIVPIYNVEPYLAQCCNSILQNSFRDFELILVNDGSTDNSYNVALQIAANDSRVILLNRENGGLSAARNTGLAHAQGEYVIFIDSDDWIEPDCFKELYDNIKTYMAEICCCRAQYVNSRNKRSVFKRKTDKCCIIGDEILIDTLEVKHFPTSACAKLYSHNFLKRHNLSFREGIVNEDTLFSIQIGCLAQKISFTNRILYNIREREGSISRSSFKRLFKDMHTALMHAMYFIKDNQKWDAEIEYIFKARYLRSILYNLLQIAQRLNYTDYKADYKYCMENTKFIEWKSYRRFLPMKHRVMCHIASSPQLLFITLRLLNKLQFRMH